MPKPYDFKSESELVDLLRNNETINKAREFFSAKIPSVGEVVIKGVTGNTFRAFRKLPVRPSVTFRNWAVNYLSETSSKLININCHPDYSNYVHEATISLCENWRNLSGAEMGYGRGAKLFNLVLKQFACLETIGAKQKQNLIELQHVPLDSYTIIGLSTIAPELLIKKQSTMNFIKTKNQYMDFQAVISKIATKAGVPPIYYDILAWDMGH